MHPRIVFALLVAACCCAAAPSAAAKPKSSETKSASETPATPARPGGRMNMMPSVPAGTFPGLPAWEAPAQYSVDLVMTFDGKSMTMRRFIDGASMRSEITAEGTQMVMLERAEEPGTTYHMIPSEKMAIKMNPERMGGKAGKQLAAAAAAETTSSGPPPKVEALGDESMAGHAAKKFRITADEHSAIAWFDAATGAPLRMENGQSVIEWKDMKSGPQAASLFEVPKKYQMIDMEAQMKQMESMGGANAAMLKGMMGGAGGGLGGIGGGMASNFAGQMGSNLGQQFGSGIGASFGGPIGAMAGGWIGGKVGGWIGNKAADIVTPGPSRK